MLNNRELQLQTIIKTLQSKIYSLKRQLSQSQQIDQTKINDQITKTLVQKEKEIEILMEENQKLKRQGKQEQSWKFVKLANDFSSTEKNMEDLKINNHDLELQITQLKKNYEEKLEQKECQLRQATIKIEASGKQRKKLLDEVQKINRFYVESIKRKPDRQETLLWVDKLIQFMTKTSQIVTDEEKNRKQALNSVILFFKDQLAQLGNQINKNQTSIMNEKNSFLIELQRWVAQAQIDYKTALKQNEQFWQGFQKIKAKQDKQTISRLQNQLQLFHHQKQKDIKELTDLLNENQKQKKALLVNLQELRNFYQLREKANREQIELLRRSLSDLMESQSLRQRQFEEQLSRMGDHIQHLTSKFYQKIELPINAVYNKIKEEIFKFKSHFQGFFSTSSLQRQIETFQQNIVQYLVYLNHYKDLRQIIKESAKECLKITDFLKHQQFASESRENESFGAYSSVTRESYLSLDTNKQQKLIYELATAKKQIEKLKEYVKQLQSKSTGNKAHNSLTNSKIIELTVQNQSYQERLQKMERNNKEGFSYNQRLMEQQKIGRVNTALLQRLLEKSQEILNYTIRQEEYIVSFSTCINSLNLIIINPMQTFQSLIKEIKSISVQQLLPSSWISQIERPNAKDLESRKNVYREILANKADISNSLQKSNLQLIKVVREYLSKTHNSKSTKEGEMPTIEKQKVSESKQMLQKRLKQVHNQRLKSKEQFLGGLKNLQQKMKNLDIKYSKKHNIPLGKLQQLFVKKVSEMMVVFEPKDKLKDIGRITQQALLDAKSKLKDCQLQNEGLLRELELFKLIRQKNKNQ